MAYDELLFESTYEKKKSGKKKWIVLFLLLLLIAAAGVFVISGGLTLIFPGLAHGSGSSPLGGGLVIDPNAGDYVAPEAPKQEQGVAIPGWGSMTIPANTQVLDMVDFHNPIANDGLYYLTFKFCLRMQTVRFLRFSGNRRQFLLENTSRRLRCPADFLPERMTQSFMYSRIACRTRVRQTVRI
jgi:hypothetical protein